MLTSCDTTVRIAITGTPGVGKTTLARLAGERLGWTVVDVKQWAHEAGCVVGHDAADDADVIDVDALCELVPDDDGSTIIYEGHLSHLLELDVAWVIRCDPRVLRARLEARGYPPAKVVENLEAEALDLILQEALEYCGRVIQVDASARSSAELLSAFAEGTNDAFKGHSIEPVDWSDQLPLR